jgi:Sulfotransferase family
MGLRVFLERLRTRPSSEATAPMPMIVGVGRSGTTFLRLMLDAHPGLAIPPETGFLIPLLDLHASAAAVSPVDLCRMITGFHTWGDFGLPAELFLSELRKLEPFSLQEGVRLFYRLYARRHGKGRWGDKTPVYGQYLPRIEEILPEAHFIHLIRDGRDVVLSLREVWFAPGQDIPTLARHWAEQVETTRLAGRRCRRYVEVRFEDLVLYTQEVLHRLCGFIDLPYAEAMETYHRTAYERLGEVGDRTLPDGRIITREQRFWQQRRTGLPPARGRVGRWRSEMSAQERRQFELLAGDLLRDLGYGS